ncbi:helix-turn-helix domain-containing protein [Ferrovibrio sp.]|uniref:helix-turn-helix domain-containing protein n=1 Tax=Ferrovibrio sp. TaxID=1917215 RepID=UPI0035B4EB53
MSQTLDRPRLPSKRSLAEGEGWSVADILCQAGPEDRPFEERHGAVSISVVAAGSFDYRTDSGHGLMHPGSFLLGNAGACFQCGHSHGRGDRCLALSFAPEVFAEIAASHAGSARYRFKAAMLPSHRRLGHAVWGLESLLHGRDAMQAEQQVFAIAETVLRHIDAGAESTVAPSVQDQRRIGRALRHIEAEAHRALDLTELASVAAMSKYHFLRQFRRITGATPYDYLIGLRLRRAAARLAAERAPVAAIAYDSGFGDLSTFNGAFRAAYGLAPGAFRRRHGVARQPA